MLFSDASGTTFVVHVAARAEAFLPLITGYFPVALVATLSSICHSCSWYPLRAHRGVSGGVPQGMEPLVLIGRLPLDGVGAGSRGNHLRARDSIVKIKQGWCFFM